MIIYGDPSFEIPLDAAWRKLAEFEQAAITGGKSETREFLIACGQIEQALADDRKPTDELERVTDAAAAALLGVTSNRPAWPNAGGGAIRVKIPEGYAFYTVYPEQFAAAARTWAESRSPGKVIVAGIRSIGTSLSATVAAQLRALNWDTSRITLRPGGHPFNRTVHLPAIPVSIDLAAIVVDEGPGLSGSSIATVVRAFRARGVSDVTIFPSHSGEPGSAASDDVRQTWRETPRIVIEPNGALIEQLRHATADLLGDDQLTFHDFSAGQWREHFNWPGGRPRAATAFERAKYLFRGRDAGVLWKFAGFGAGRGFESMTQRAFERQQTLAADEWTVPPLAQLDGFIATPWIEGDPIHASQLDDCMIDRLARYIITAATPAEDWSASVQRLQEMSAFNLSKDLNPNRRVEDMPGAGDGRMAPHEWIRTGDVILKTDVWGHASDHTCIGPQPILWDIAGAIHSWQMNREQTLAFLRALHRAGLPLRASHLAPYLTAWQAFEAGMFSLQLPESAHPPSTARAA